MARILVTGAAGLLGSTLVPRLSGAGHDVVRWSRSSGDIRADPVDWAAARDALESVRPDVIINLAANTSVDECERHPQLAYTANVRIVENLARWVRHVGGPVHLVHLSTDQVYDGAGPHDEDNVTITNTYGFSKYAGELAAAAAAATVLRTNFFGRSECPGRSSLSDWIVEALRKREPITVFEDVMFSPLSIRSLADVIGLTVKQRRAGTFNAGSADGMSKADFAIRLAEALELPTDRIHRGSSADASLVARRPTDMRMNSSRFSAAFGVQLPCLRDEIQSVRADYANDP